MKAIKSALSTIPGLRPAYYELIRIARGEPRITPGDFDLSMLPALLGKDDPVILDIGAYDGTHSARFASLFPASHIYSFEPLPQARERFRQIVQSNRVRLFDVAISDKDGTANFYVSGGLPSEELAEQFPEGWNCSSSLRAPKAHLQAHPGITFEETITVKTVRLDTWRKEENIETIDFIWADTQGAEVDLIEGGRETLARTRYFYTEYYNLEMYEGQQPLRNILKMLPDFKVITRYGTDVLLKNNLI